MFALREWPVIWVLTAVVAMWPLEPAVVGLPFAQGGAVAPDVVVEPEEIDFGEIWRGERIDRPVRFRNQGTACVRVLLQESLGCGNALCRKVIVDRLEPNSSATWMLQFDSHNRRGAVDVLLRFEFETLP